MKVYKTIWISLSVILMSFQLRAATLAETHQGKQFYLGVHPVSLYSFDSYTHPFAVGYFVRPEVLVGAANGATRDNFHRAGIQYTASETSIWARYFLYNSVDLMLRLRTLNLNFSNHYIATSTGLRADYTGQFRGKTLGLGIGNRWSWSSGLSLGVDWLVANALFGTSSSLQVTSNAGIPQAELNSATSSDQSTVKRFAGLPSVAVLSLGYLF